MKYTLIALSLLLLSSIAKYNADTALNMVYASGLAYCDAENILASKCNKATTLTEDAGMKVLHAKDNGEGLNGITYVILEWAKKKKFIVGFSGTRDPYQLVTEILKAYPMSYKIHPEIKDALVFNYFYEHYKNEFKDDFMQVIESLYSQSKYSSYDIIFTGHSLGGAMTIHAVADFVLSRAGTQNLVKDIMKSSSKPNVQVYTFGQPRIGNPAFIDPVSAKVDEWYRLVHNRDIVAHIPP